MNVARMLALGLALSIVALAGRGPALAEETGVPASLPAMALSDPALDPEKDDAQTLALRISQERMTVPVSFGAHGPFPFLVDTGAERTVITSALARELGLAVSSRARLVGSLRSADVDLVELDDLDIGDRNFPGLSAVVLEAGHVGAAGIIGIDSLQDQRVVFDFQRGEISIGRSPNSTERFARITSRTEGYDIVVTAKRQRDRMIIADAFIDGIRMRVVIDTGSNFSIGNTALRDRLRKLHSLGEADLYDVTGAEAPREVIRAGRMEVGGILFNGPALLINDSPAFAELGLADTPALLLGMNHLRTFRRVAVDFHRRKVSFDLDG